MKKRKKNHLLFFQKQDEDGDVREEIADEYAIEEDIEPIVVPEDDCGVFEDDDTELAEENEANLDSVEEQVCPRIIWLKDDVFDCLLWIILLT
ncbi:unnamed protein product [Cochlearia groenlandica]